MIQESSEAVEAVPDSEPCAVLQHVVLDKLSTTVDVSLGERDAVEKRLHSFVENGYGRRFRVKGYRKGVQFAVGNFSGATMLVGFQPQFDSAFLRFEWNPAWNCAAEIRGLIDGILPGGYAQLVAAGIVTRIDAAVDVRHAPLSDLAVWAAKKQIGYAFHKGARMRSYALGGADSEKSLLVYDKREQLKAWNRKHLCKVPVPPFPVTRIEASDYTRRPMSSLAEVPNLFSTMHVAYLPDISDGDWRFRQFLHVVRAFGAQFALADLPFIVRTTFAKRLAESAPQWWDVEVVWKSWPDAVSGVLVPPPALYSVNETAAA